MNESRYPWFILVPERENIVEIHQLTDEDQVQLIRESSHFAGVLAELFRADKMNIAAIGNLVPQLHLHHVVRYRNDPAWPGPIWGRFDPKPYDERAVIDVKENSSTRPYAIFLFRLGLWNAGPVVARVVSPYRFPVRCPECRKASRQAFAARI